MKRVVGQAIKSTFKELVSDHVRQLPFWVLVGFLPTYIIERNLVSYEPSLFVTVHGVHVHHFTWGVIILAITGYVSLLAPKRAMRWLAVAYGVGLSLAFDEFGMWLHLTSNYNLDQSEDVMVGILFFLVAAVYFVDFLHGVLRLIYPRAAKPRRNQRK